MLLQRYFLSLCGGQFRLSAPGQNLVVVVAVERIELDIIRRIVAVNVALRFCVEVLRALVASLTHLCDGGLVWRLNLLGGSGAGRVVVLLEVGLRPLLEGAALGGGQVQIVLEVVLVSLLLSHVQLGQEFRRVLDLHPTCPKCEVDARRTRR